MEDFETSAISLIILITSIVKRLERDTFKRKKKRLFWKKKMQLKVLFYSELDS